MIEAKEGNIDVDYFKNMVQNKEATEHKQGLSGRGGYDYKVDHLSGWILNFFAYIKHKAFDEYEQFKLDDIGVKDFERLPSQMLTVPFKIRDINKKEYLMKYNVGFIGCDQNEKKEVYPVTGWIFSPSTAEDINSLL